MKLNICSALSLTVLLGSLVAASTESLAESSGKSPGDEPAKSGVKVTPTLHPWSVGVEGIVVYPGVNVVGGYTFSPFVSLEGRYGLAQSSQNLQGSFMRHREVSGGARVFVWGSWNIGLFPAVHWYEAEYGHKIGELNEPNVSAHAMDLGVSCSIGNQWKIGRLGIGFDWVGFFTPTYRVNNGLRNDAGLSSPRRSAIQEDFDKKQLPGSGEGIPRLLTARLVWFL